MIFRFPKLKTLAMAAACSVALVAPPAAQAQDKPVILKLSSWVPAQHALNPALAAWAESLKKASGGSISATLFPGEQLGKAFDHYDMARDGIADVAYVNPGYQPGRFPIFAAASLPFQVANAKGGSAAVDAWYRAYAAKEMKDVQFCFAFVHDPGSLHSRKKVVLPGDIKNMKVRPATSTIGQMITTLGGTNVQASAPESRDMIERGVADANTFPGARSACSALTKWSPTTSTWRCMSRRLCGCSTRTNTRAWRQRKGKPSTSTAAPNGPNASARPGPSSKSPAAPKLPPCPAMIWCGSRPSRSMPGARPWPRSPTSGRMT